MTDPKIEEALRRLAERGTPRGAGRVLDDAARTPVARPFDERSGARSGRRPAAPARYAIAAAVIALVAAGGVAYSLRDGEGTTDVAAGPSNFCETMEASPLNHRDVSWVYVDPEATAEVIEDVGEVLEALPEVESVRYVDRDETFQDFTELFRDDPAMLENVRPEQLPTSYEVRLVDRRAETGRTLKEAMARRPGVYEVKVPTDATTLAAVLVLGASSGDPAVLRGALRSEVVDGSLLLVDDLTEGAAPAAVLRDVDTLADALLVGFETLDRGRRVEALRAKERLVDYIGETCDLDLGVLLDLSNGIVPSDVPRLDEGD